MHWLVAALLLILGLILLAAILHALADVGPLGFRAVYEREVRARLATPEPSRSVTEADVERLPTAVRRYLHLTGAIGQPRVHHVRAAWRGRIRPAPDARWMEFTAEQHDFIDEPARFFLMRAKRGGLPVHVLHAYHAPDIASMRVRLLGLFPIVHARGPEMRRYGSRAAGRRSGTRATASGPTSIWRWSSTRSTARACVDERTASASRSAPSSCGRADLQLRAAGRLSASLRTSESALRITSQTPGRMRSQ